MQEAGNQIQNTVIRLAQTSFDDILLASIFHYPDIATTIVQNTPGDIFSDQNKRFLFQAIKDFVAENHRAPTIEEFKVFLEDWLARHNRSRELPVFIRLLSSLLNISPPGKDWLLNHLSKLIKLQQFRTLFTQAPALIERRDVEEIQRRFFEIVYRNPFTADGFENLLAKEPTIEDLIEQHEFNFPTRIYALDDHIQGVMRKELWVIMAGLNVGKSWACLHFAVSALLNQRSVLFLTLEMSKQKVQKRFYQMMAGLVRPEDPDELLRTISVYDPFEDTYIDIDVPTFSNLEELNASLQTLRLIAGSAKFVLREHPSLSLTPEGILAEVDQFIAHYGHPPDLLVVDGLGDIRVPKTRGYEDFGYAVRLLRSIASKNDLSVIVTHQANRAGLSAQTLTAEHTGRDIQIMQVADVGITLSQTPEEYRQQVMRLRVERARGARKWLTFKLFQDFRIGQFCIASVEEEETQ